MNGVIGNSQLNKMAWHVPEELKHFKDNTMGKVIVMGRKTTEETGKLRGRDCIVLSKDPGYKLDGFTTLTIEELLTMNEYDFDKQYAICGGAEIYRQLIPYASFAIISYMDFEAKGDVLMPPINRSDWRRVLSTTHNKFTADHLINTNRLEFVKISNQLLNKGRKKHVKV